MLAENENVMREIRVDKGEVIVTDRRLIYSQGNYFADAMLPRITSIRALSESKKSYLLISISCFIVWFIFLQGALKSTFELFKGSFGFASTIFLFIAIIFLLLYLRSIKSGIFIYVESADPIQIAVKGAKSKKAVIEIFRATRHRSGDIVVEMSSEKA